MPHYCKSSHFSNFVFYHDMIKYLLHCIKKSALLLAYISNTMNCSQMLCHKINIFTCFRLQRIVLYNIFQKKSKYQLLLYYNTMHSIECSAVKSTFFWLLIFNNQYTAKYNMLRHEISFVTCSNLQYYALYELLRHQIGKFACL